MTPLVTPRRKLLLMMRRLETVPIHAYETNVIKCGFLRSSRKPTRHEYQACVQHQSSRRPHVTVWLNRPTCTRGRKKWTFFWRWTSMGQVCTDGPVVDHWRGLARRFPHYIPQTALVRNWNVFGHVHTWLSALQRMAWIEREINPRWAGLGHPIVFLLYCYGGYLFVRFWPPLVAGTGRGRTIPKRVSLGNSCVPSADACRSNVPGSYKFVSKFLTKKATPHQILTYRPFSSFGVQPSDEFGRKIAARQAGSGW